MYLKSPSNLQLSVTFLNKFKSSDTFLLENIAIIKSGAYPSCQSTKLQL